MVRSTVCDRRLATCAKLANYNKTQELKVVDSWQPQHVSYANAFPVDDILILADTQPTVAS